MCHKYLFSCFDFIFYPIRADLDKAIATIFQYYGGFLMDIGDMDLTDE